MNLIDTVMKQLGPAAGPLSGLLGEDESKTHSALGAILPTVLAGFAGNADTPEGTKRLNAAVDEADDDPAARFGEMLRDEAPPQDALGLLGGLLGGGGDVVSKLTGVLTRFLGIKEGSVSKLLAMAVPLVLGYLKKHKQEQGLDDAGFGRALAGQKSQIAAALPDGLGKMLAGTAGLGSLGSIVQGLAGSAGDTARQAVSEMGGAAKKAGHAATTAAAGTPSMLSKILPIVVVAVIAILLWKLLSGTRDEPATVSAPPTVESTVEALDLLAGETGKALSGITDAASAREALPALGNVAERLDAVAGSIDQLPSDAHERITGWAGQLLADLRPVVDKVMAVPGVREVLEPVLGPILQTMESLAKP